MSTRNWLILASAIAAFTSASGAVHAGKGKGKKAAAAQASEQTAAAVSDLQGKFTWGLTVDEAQKLVEADMAAKFNEKLSREANPFRQDAIRKEHADQLKRFRDGYVKFDGQKTGWDVSLVDKEFSHNNDESMFIVWENQQRRFMFFYNGHLWKQFIAFDAEHPAFAGKTFDDFADRMQGRFGAAAMTFRKKLTSDEQTFDHLEWPPAGDTMLWAIDETQFYGHFCLSVFQKSRGDELAQVRKERASRKSDSSDLIDQITRKEKNKVDVNADVVDDVTGRPSRGKDEEKSDDPLKGTKF